MTTKECLEKFGEIKVHSRLGESGHSSIKQELDGKVCM